MDRAARRKARILQNSKNRLLAAKGEGSDTAAQGDTPARQAGRTGDAALDEVLDGAINEVLQEPAARVGGGCTPSPSSPSEATPAPVVAPTSDGGTCSSKVRRRRPARRKVPYAQLEESQASGSPTDPAAGQESKERPSTFPDPTKPTESGGAVLAEDTEKHPSPSGTPGGKTPPGRQWLWRAALVRPLLLVVIPALLGVYVGVFEGGAPASVGSAAGQSLPSSPRAQLVSHLQADRETNIGGAVATHATERTVTPMVLLVCGLFFLADATSFLLQHHGKAQSSTEPRILPLFQPSTSVLTRAMAAYRSLRDIQQAVAVCFLSAGGTLLLARMLLQVAPWASEGVEHCEVPV
mmetsp:Transcript_3096/g.8939  ORF Transcript_3096/g.8939 Transcript_3096/m.8939 type:complete len:352 (-) Transcript_3096:256-1311(-)|eukprot:CAMPEP_0118974920 /NCGR_PEP_ID=MMETSP1173-20130426/13898_1 /TAXON_ID=1034831 /ORGANISM="Rhizochromulina marina cf, Strain CCMP1243" /LENGTH=351 /DNA_ID=CAMNT_0006924731 /DNA_START=97 /DNA_END=1152 /DNA_ORIENTATION=+